MKASKRLLKAFLTFRRCESVEPREQKEVGKVERLRYWTLIGRERESLRFDWLRGSLGGRKRKRAAWGAVNKAKGGLKDDLWLSF